MYPATHVRQLPTSITVHTNATVLGILNKAATLFRMLPKSDSAHNLSFGTRNSHDSASTLEEIRVQDDGVIRLLTQASGGVGIIHERTEPLATSLDCSDRQTLFSAKCGSRISSLNLADKSRVVGEYGGNIELISSRPFDITIRSPNQVDVNGQAKKKSLGLYTGSPRHSDPRYSKTSGTGISAVARSLRGVSILLGLSLRRGSYVDEKTA